MTTYNQQYVTLACQRVRTKHTRWTVQIQWKYSSQMLLLIIQTLCLSIVAINALCVHGQKQHKTIKDIFEHNRRNSKQYGHFVYEYWEPISSIRGNQWRVGILVCVNKVYRKFWCGHICWAGHPLFYCSISQLILLEFSLCYCQPINQGDNINFAQNLIPTTDRTVLSTKTIEPRVIAYKRCCRILNGRH